VPLGSRSGGCHRSDGQWRGAHAPQLVIWGFCVGYRFQREESRGGRQCREAAEGVGAFADAVDIVQDRFGLEVVGERLSLVRGACFELELEHGLGHAHGVPEDVL
jgi:hypothetical protein